MSVFNSWCEVRKESSDIVRMDPAIIQEKLCRFVMEARRQDGACYPPNSLDGIVTGIHRYLREGGRHEICFLSTSGTSFLLY